MTVTILCFFFSGFLLADDLLIISLRFCCQCLETLVSRQMDMQLFLADGCKEALLEEKRRFCFLVDKHCMFSYQTASFHDKVQGIRGIISSDLSLLWARRCRVYIQNLTSSRHPSRSILFRSLRSPNLLRYHGDGKTLN